MPRQHDTPLVPPHPSADTGAPTSPRHPTYHIRLKGHIGTRWSDWFDHLTITLDENGETLLSGPIVDQAALHAILTRIRDLGLPLVSVIEIDTADPGNPVAHSHKETTP